MKYLLILSVTICLLSCIDEQTQKPAPDVDLQGFTSLKEIKDATGNTYKIGFEQKSDGSYQNPFVQKSSADGQSVWKVYYEQSSVDGRGVMLAMDADGLTPIAIFTVDGGSYDDKYITTHKSEAGAYANVYQDSYDAGGGPKVSIVAKLNPETGRISKATFITARKNDGKTNGFSVNEMKITADAIILLTTTSAWPPGEGSSYQRYPDISDADRVDGWFKMYYELSPDLSSIDRAELLVN